MGVSVEEKVDIQLTPFAAFRSPRPERIDRSFRCKFKTRTEISEIQLRLFAAFRATRSKWFGGSHWYQWR